MTKNLNDAKIKLEEKPKGPNISEINKKFQEDIKKEKENAETAEKELKN